jgi:hypothetical protein
LATIDQYKLDYAAAYKIGDHTAMRAANDGANAIRTSTGVAIQDSSVGDAKRAAEMKAPTPTVPAPTAPAPTNTMQYKDPTGMMQTGYSINDKTYKDAAGTNRIDAGSVVGGKWLMTDADKGIDISANKAANLYGKDTALGTPITTRPLGQTYGVGGQYFDSKTGTTQGSGFVDVGGGKYYDIETGQTLDKYEMELAQRNQAIQNQYKDLMKAQLDANKSAVDSGTRDLTAAQERGLQGMDAEARASQIAAYQNMDNMALRSAKLGDQGGIGQRQYSMAANANDSRLMEINLEKKNLITSTEQQIAKLKAEGKFQDAQVVATLGQKQLDALISEQDKILNRQQNQELTESDLLGTYRGQQTTKSKEVSFNNALKRLQLGMFSAEDAAALGVPQAQVDQFVNYINMMAQIDLEKAKLQLGELTQMNSGGGTTSTGGGLAGSKNTQGSAINGSNTASREEIMGDLGRIMENIEPGTPMKQYVYVERALKHLDSLVADGRITEQYAEALAREIGLLQALEGSQPATSAPLPSFGEVDRSGDTTTAPTAPAPGVIPPNDGGGYNWGF